MNNLPLFTHETLSGFAGAERILGYYQEDMPAQLSAIQTAMQENNYVRVAEIAHSLKSSSRQIGAIQMGAAAEEVEHAARSTPVAANLSLHVKTMAECGQATLTAMQAYQKYQHTNQEG